MRTPWTVVALLLLLASCVDPPSTLSQDQEAVVVGDGGIARRSTWSFWDHGALAGTTWQSSGFDDSAWARGAGPLGYGETYLATAVGYGGNPNAKYITTYFRAQFTVADPSAVTAMHGDLMYDDGIVVTLNGHEIGRSAMPAGAITASTLAGGHEANDAYERFDWTAQKGWLVAGTNTIAVEVHQAAASSSDLVFDLGLVLDVAPPPPTGGNIARGSTWAYWDRGGDLGSAWRDGSYNASSWARGAGPLGYGETYLHTTIGYGGNATAKYITSYFRKQFTVDDPAAVSAMVGELMYDDGVVVYLNGTRIDGASMPAGTTTASTLALGHEADNAYVRRDWTAQKGLLVAGLNTIAVEVHQAAASSSDLVFDLSLTLTTAAPPPASDDLPRRSVWTYWDRGGDLGTAWRNPSYDDTTWASGAGPLGYGETYHQTTIGYGGDPLHKYITTYFRASFFLEDPAAVTQMLAGLMYDDGLVVYINGQELGRWQMPAGPITASTLANNYESGNVYEAYEWSFAARPMLVPGENVIAVEVHQSSASSSDLTFDLELINETATREPTPSDIPSGSTWGYWDRGGDLGPDWTAPDYPETGWRSGTAPFGFGESYLTTTTRSGPITTYFRHDFQRWGSPSEWVLEAMYDDGFVAYLNGTEILRVGLPAGPITPSTLATNHEANGFERFALAGAESLVVDGINTLAIEVHQSSTTSSDLVWDARMLAESPWPVAWVRQNSGTNQTLTDVWFTDAMHGWITGWNGTLLRTVDGGVTWTPQDVGVDDYLRSIQFVDAQHGFIGSFDHVLATVDGGNTWSVRAAISGDLSFVDASTGWLAGGTGVYRTDDGGATWQQELPGDNVLYHAIDFVDASHGWAVGQIDAGEGTHVNGESIVVHTSDGGATWQEQLGVGDWEQSLGPLDATSPSFAYVVGNGSNHTSIGEYKYVTRDGTTWQSVADSSNRASLSDIQFVGANLAWAVGYAGSIIHSTDAGATWTAQETARWEYWQDHSRTPNPTLYGVYFLDANNGWAVGADGTILKTTNGGNP